MNFYLQVEATRKHGKFGKKLAEVIRKQFDSLLAKAKHDEWVEKLRRASGDLFRCVEFPEVPMDNNHAERCLRELVVHRKIKGHISSDVLLVLLGFSESCQLQGKNLREELGKILGV